MPQANLSMGNCLPCGCVNILPWKPGYYTCVVVVVVCVFTCAVGPLCAVGSLFCLHSCHLG